MIELLLEVRWEEGRYAFEFLEELLSNLVLLTRINLDLQTTHINNFILNWETVFKLGKKLIVIHCKGPLSVSFIFCTVQRKKVGSNYFPL
uniref:Uncharacterized protein n=1 Tax=Arundo donax TaxID=35708 RepID=A0A0A9G524_ARUDO